MFALFLPVFVSFPFSSQASRNPASYNPHPSPRPLLKNPHLRAPCFVSELFVLPHAFPPFATLSLLSCLTIHFPDSKGRETPNFPQMILRAGFQKVFGSIQASSQDEELKACPDHSPLLHIAPISTSCLSFSLAVESSQHF